MKFFRRIFLILLSKIFIENEGLGTRSWPLFRPHSVSDLKSAILSLIISLHAQFSPELHTSKVLKLFFGILARQLADETALRNIFI